MLLFTTSIYFCFSCVWNPNGKIPSFLQKRVYFQTFSMTHHHHHIQIHDSYMQGGDKTLPASLTLLNPQILNLQSTSSFLKIPKWRAKIFSMVKSK